MGANSCVGLHVRKKWSMVWSNTKHAPHEKCGIFCDWPRLQWNYASEGCAGYNNWCGALSSIAMFWLVSLDASQMIQPTLHFFQFIQTLGRYSCKMMFFLCLNWTLELAWSSVCNKTLANFSQCVMRTFFMLIPPSSELNFFQCEFLHLVGCLTSALSLMIWWMTMTCLMFVIVLWIMMWSVVLALPRCNSWLCMSEKRNLAIMVGYLSITGRWLQINVHGVIWCTAISAMPAYMSNLLCSTKFAKGVAAPMFLNQKYRLWNAPYAMWPLKVWTYYMTISSYILLGPGYMSPNWHVAFLRHKFGFEQVGVLTMDAWARKRPE